MLQSGQTGIIRRIRVIVYLILGMAVLMPAIDTMANLWPSQLSSLTWRYGALALFSNSLSAPLLVLLLILVFAALVDDKLPLVIVTALAIAAGLASFGALAALLLDYIQLRARLAIEHLPKLDLSTAMTALKLLVNGLLYCFLALSAHRSRRVLQSAAESRVNVQGPYFVKTVGAKNDDA